MSSFERDGDVAAVGSLVDEISAQSLQAFNVMVNDLPTKSEIFNSMTVRGVCVAPRGERRGGFRVGGAVQRLNDCATIAFFTGTKEFDVFAAWG